MSRKIVCFSGSNTYGYDPRSYLGGRYPESVRWTGLLKVFGWEVWNEDENGRPIYESWAWAPDERLTEKSRRLAGCYKTL